MATNPTVPIEVNPNPLPASLATLLRYVLTFVGGLAVSKGVLPADSDVNELVGAVVAVAATAYGIWRTIRNKKELVVAAEAAPNSVATVTR